jgi:hypothetical protein
MKRREFMKWSAATGGCLLIPTISLSAVADDPLVTLDDPQAKALGYVEASEVEGQSCANCVHGKGDLSAENIGCNLFPGKQVKGAGWCKVWAARP